MKTKKRGGKFNPIFGGPKGDAAGGLSHGGEYHGGRALARFDRDPARPTGDFFQSSCADDSGRNPERWVRSERHTAFVEAERAQEVYWAKLSGWVIRCVIS